MKLDKEHIKKILSIYGHLIPEYHKIDSYMFSKLIKAHFNASNPITIESSMYISKCTNLYYIRSNG
jgi:hypothetical protein